LDDLQASAAGQTLALFRALALPSRTLDQILVCVAQPAFRPSDADTAAATLHIRAAKARMRQGLALIDEAEALARARRALAPARRTLRGFLHELNLASVAPVLVFDAARLGPQPAIGGEGVRYGIGGGIRVSLVNAFHVTAAYAWNPDPKGEEQRGAFFFSLDVSEFVF
jgi:hypothetical protein